MSLSPAGVRIPWRERCKPALAPSERTRIKSDLAEYAADSDTFCLPDGNWSFQSRSAGTNFSPDTSDMRHTLKTLLGPAFFVPEGTGHSRLQSLLLTRVRGTAGGSFIFRRSGS